MSISYPTSVTEVPEEPGAFQESIDDAFIDFMVEHGFYIKEGTGYITNPSCSYSSATLESKWLDRKKALFGTTTNKEPK